ncbi:hypothetical protein T265_10279 [Opisthorchis viverrini]|uniref:Uncharacterized protein n=1 Tax=Opisthorchis viverrini TaxID=6198 RepID=A0A074ZDV4_OPIVI|nr:hypothetical protein T265_10279 [Opisthorchis viverrini]KER21375.1 hypothetical protein T265_10279 [Opisthorchis viverrini]
MRRPRAAHSVAWEHHKREIRLRSSTSSISKQHLSIGSPLISAVFWLQSNNQGCRRIFSNLMSSVWRLYMYRDISNVVPGEI